MARFIAGSITSGNLKVKTSKSGKNGTWLILRISEVAHLSRGSHPCPYEIAGSRLRARERSRVQTSVRLHNTFFRCSQALRCTVVDYGSGYKTSWKNRFKTKILRLKLTINLSLWTFNCDSAQEYVEDALRFSCSKSRYVSCNLVPRSSLGSSGYEIMFPVLPVHVYGFVCYLYVMSERVTKSSLQIVHEWLATWPDRKQPITFVIT